MPVVANGIVYIGVNGYGLNSADYSIIALNTNHGTKIWKHLLPIYTGSQLLLYNGTIYVGTGDGQLHALHASDGSEVWHTMLSNQPGEGFFMASGQDDPLLVQ